MMIILLFGNGKRVFFWREVRVLEEKSRIRMMLILMGMGRVIRMVKRVMILVVILMGVIVMVVVVKSE